MSPIGKAIHHRPRVLAALVCGLVALLLGSAGDGAGSGVPEADPQPMGGELPRPYLLVLGVAQDGGVPQAGNHDHPAWDDASLRRSASCLALVDPASGRRWLFDATPDFRQQLYRLDRAAPSQGQPVLDGIFLTHAHIGHYSGLMMLGHEVMGAQQVPVHAMPRMAAFLRANGPWSQLVRYHNIVLEELTDGQPVELGGGLSVTPFLVPHRQEFSEVVGFRISGASRTILYLPDIDRWQDWRLDLATALAGVDTAYLDGTFYANGEIAGRDMSTFPHPFITTTMDLLQPLEATQRAKVRFIHLNHTNPALLPDSAARREVLGRGYGLAEEGERLEL